MRSFFSKSKPTKPKPMFCSCCVMQETPTMNSMNKHAELLQPQRQRWYVTAIVLPPVLLIVLLSIALAMLIREASKSKRGNATAATFAETLTNRAKYYEKATSIDRSAGVQETHLAAIAMQKKREFGDKLIDWQSTSRTVRAADLMREPNGSMVDLYAEEAQPILDAIRETAESKTPVWDPGASRYVGQDFDIKQLLNVIRFEAYAALRENNSQRVLAALELIPGISKNLEYGKAFDQYFWFQTARDFHRELVCMTLEAGIWTDTKSLDEILAQLDEFDRMGRDRAGLPSPWKDSWLYDVDSMGILESSELTMGQKLVTAVFGDTVITQKSPRSDTIHDLDTGQRFVRTAVNIKKYQLLNSKFPKQLADLREIGFSISSQNFSDSESFVYFVDSQAIAHLSLNKEPSINRLGTPIVYPTPIQIQ